MKTFVTWVVIFVVGLLVGFIPQYWKAHNLRADLETCNTAASLSQVKQSAALTYVTATQLNYGVAAGYAQQMFAQAQNLANSSTDNNVRNLMNQVLSSRDKITADLAKGDSAVIGELQPVVLQLEKGGQ
jgi:hypothetical protein